jgi:hypothetical protein
VEPGDDLVRHVVGVADQGVADVTPQPRRIERAVQRLPVRGQGRGGAVASSAAPRRGRSPGPWVEEDERGAGQVAPAPRSTGRVVVGGDGLVQKVPQHRCLVGHPVAVRGARDTAESPGSSRRKG